MASYNDGISYAQDVVAGNIVACKQVKQSCQRFLDDLDRDDWRWTFSIKHVNHVLNFITKACKHVKGPLAGQLIKLEPWQVFIFCNVYGWIDLDNGERRFQYVLLEVARKNGKSLFASAIALYELLFGDEGSDIYSVATKREQARICFDAAVRMYEKMPEKFANKYRSYQAALTVPDKWSKYVPQGRDSKTGDGLNPSLNIFDEAAAYSDRNAVEVMTSACGARLNYMNLFITTAQFTKVSVYFEQRTYLEGLLSGKFDDDRYFGLIYTLDPDDDWTDEEVWIKANPGLGVAPSVDFLRNECKQAQEITAKRNSFLVKQLNVWTNNAESWIDSHLWDRPENLVEEVTSDGELYIGMDLAMTDDLTALAMLYVNGDHYEADFKCFLPEHAMQNASVHVQPIYREAHRRGSLILTEGSVTDYNFLEQYIRQLAETKKLQAIAYDPYNACQLVTNLEQDNLPLLRVGQSIGHISPAAKETQRLIMRDEIKHTLDPFITWQLENCSVYTDLNDNIKVRKGEDHTQKIDAIIALIMAVSLAAGKLEEEKVASISFIQF